LQRSYNVTVSTDDTLLSSTSGYYKVEVTDANGCKALASKFIEDHPMPLTEISYNGVRSICQEPGIFKATLSSAFNAGNYNYQWYEDGQEISDSVFNSYTLSIDKNVLDTITYSLQITSGICVQQTPDITITVLPQSAGYCNPVIDPNTCPSSVSFTVDDACQPFGFTNTSSQPDGFTWSFGDDSTSTDKDPTDKVYTKVGIYHITLRHDTCAAITRTVELPVQALFTMQDVVCEQQTVAFEDQSIALATSSIESWIWNFGDGTGDIAGVGSASTNHTFSSDGTYNVTLTVFGKNINGQLCEHTDSLEVKVNALPVTTVDIVAPSCDDDLYSFTSSNQDILSYLWDLGDGDISSSASPSKRYTVLGTKSIVLIITDDTECKDTITTSVEAIAPVLSSPIIIPTQQTYICEGDSVELVSPVSIASYTWLRNGIALQENTQSLYAKLAGEYIVEYAVTGCTLQSEPVTINSFTPSVSINPNGLLCLGNDGVLEVVSNNAYTVNWQRNDTLLSDIGAILNIDDLALTDNGSYIAVLTEKTSGCGFNTPVFDLVSGTIPATVSLLASTSAVCYGGETKIYKSAATVGLAHEWTVSNQVSTSVDDTLRLSGLTFNKTVSLKVTEPVSGCFSSSTNKIINVGQQESVSLSVPNESCEYTSVSIKTGKSGSDFDFQWFRNGDSLDLRGASAELVSIIQADSGDYHVVVTSKGLVPGCVTTSDTVKLKILAAPVIPAIGGDTTFCKGEKATLTTTLTGGFVWSTFEMDQDLDVYQAGTYNLTVTNPITGCFSRASQTIVQHELPNLSFVGTGTYERCATDPIEFAGLSQYPYYQWKRNGVAIGNPNTAILPRLTASYTVEARTVEGCIAKSDTLRITSLPCACEVVTALDGIGIGSLRDAVYCANAKEGLDFIQFKIPNTIENIIQLDSALPVFTEGVIMDGFSQKGEGIYNIVIQANAYTGTALSFAFGVEETELRGLKIKGFDKGIYFASNAENTQILDNKIEANQVAIEFSNGGRKGLVKGNELTTTASGFSRGVLLHKGIDTKVVENTLNGFSKGISVLEGTGVLAKANVVTSTTTGEEGIVIGGDDNEASSNNIQNYTKGIYVPAGMGNTLSENILQANTQGIDLEIGANNNKPTPLIQSNSFINNNYIVKGLGTPKDKIELFLNDNTDQNALVFLYEAVVDNGGNWQIKIPKAVAEAYAHKWVIATGTDTLGSTSELSIRYKLILVDDVSCTVINTNDVGEGSFRETINLVNNGFCTLVGFNIPNVGTQEIPVIAGPIEIKAPTGVEIDGSTQPNGDSIILTGQFLVFNHQQEAKVNDLVFRNQARLLVLTDSITVTNSQFENTQFVTAFDADSLNKEVHIDNCTFIGGVNSIDIKNVEEVSIINSLFFNNNTAISLQGVKGFLIENDSLLDVGGQQIRISGSERGQILSNYSRGSGLSTGIHLTSVLSTEINDCSFEQGAYGVWLQGGIDSLAINRAKITKVSETGIIAGTDGTTRLYIDALELTNAKRGIYMDMNESSIINCIIDSVLETGIRFYGNQGGVINSVIRGNKITRFGVSGIYIGQGHDNVFEGNIIGDGQGTGISGLRSIYNYVIKDNYIGVDTNGVALPITGNGIHIVPSANEVSNISIVGNKVFNIDETASIFRAGIFVSNLVNGEIHDNELYSGATTQLDGIKMTGTFHGNSIIGNSVSGFKKGLVLNDFLTSDSNTISKNTFVRMDTIAILLLNGANNNKQVPVIAKYVFENGNYIITGTAIKKDTVEIFLNDSLPQHALSYLFSVKADDAGEWSLTIPEAVVKSYSDNWLVATATDTLGNTSQLSLPLKLDILPNNACTVANVNNAGEGSFRQAVWYANKGFCPLIDFNISTSTLQDTITLLGSDVTLQHSDVIIDATTESGYIQGSPSVMITGRSVLVFNANDVQVKGIEFYDVSLGFSVAERGLATENKLTSTSSFNSLNAQNSSNQTQFVNNVVDGSRIYVQNSTSVVVKGNDFLKANTAAISVDQANGVLIQNNKISNAVDGMLIVQTNNALVENNELNTISDRGIWLRGSNNTIQKNIVSETGNFGLGIESFSNNNIVSKNSFTSSAMQGIKVFNALNNTFSQNTFEDIEEKAIDLSGVGNTNKQAPVLVSTSIPSHSFTGTAVQGDVVEVFVNGGRGNQNALTYIGNTTTTTDGTWSFIVPNQYYDASINNYYVATATDINANTSELSDVIKVGDKPIFCYVTTVADTGVGSFRAAVKCINEAGSNKSIGAKVVFDLPAGRSEIPVIDSGFVITNKFGVEIDAKTRAIALQANINMPYAFNWEVNNVRVKGLELDGFDKGFDLSNTIFTRLTNNKLLNMTTAVKVVGGQFLTLEGNQVDSVNQGFDISNQKNLRIRFNDVKTTQQSIVLDDIEGLVLEQNIRLQSATTVVEVKNSKTLDINKNDIIGGNIGFEFSNSSDGEISENRIDSCTVKGIELVSSLEFYLTKNTANGLSANAEVISLNYNQTTESNEGLEVPEIKLATYKNHQLILKGFTETPESTIELFTSDSIGADLITYVTTTKADVNGDFEFKLNISPENINDNYYRATVTYPIEYLGGNEKIYTSEASPTFYPNLKVCFVTKDTDVDEKGTLRYNIGLANNNECSLMLFEIDYPVGGPKTINLGNDLPVIIAKNLTIDATYQPGYTDVPLITVMSNNQSIAHAFEVNADTASLAIHGIEIDGFQSPFHIEQAHIVENSLSFFNDFEEHAVTFGTNLSAEVLLESSVYASDQLVDYILDLTRNNIKVIDNTLRGGVISTIYIGSDTNTIIGNTFEQVQEVQHAAIESANTDTNYIANNVIEDYKVGVMSNQDKLMVISGNEIFSKNRILEKAIIIDSCETCAVIGNEIMYADTAIYITYSPEVDCAANELDTIYTSGILISHSDTAFVHDNILNVEHIGIQLDSSDHVLLLANTIINHDSVGVLVDSKALLLNDLIGNVNIKDNKVEMKNLGSAIYITNTDSLFLENNTIATDSNTAIIHLKNVSSSVMKGNIIKAPTAVLFEECDSLLVFENEVDKKGKGIAFDFKNSEQIKLSQNIISTKDTARVLIDLHLANADSTSNHKKFTPVIDGYRVQLVGECSDTNHTSIFLYGRAEALDSIELFVLDTSVKSFDKYVVTGGTDDLGNWTIKIPKQFYERELEYNYSFIVTATDSLWATSQESDPYRFDSVVNRLVVKTLIDTGAETLREAVEGINCSDIHTIVNFEIDVPAPYEIVLEDSLPAFKAWRGFTIKAQESQGEYLQSKDPVNITSPVENEIIVNAALVDSVPIFHLTSPDVDGWGTIEGMSITDAENAIYISGAKHELTDLNISHATRGLQAIKIEDVGEIFAKSLDIQGYDTAVVMRNSDGNTIENSSFRTNKVTILLVDGSSGNHVEENHLEQVDSIGVLLSNVSGTNFVENNTFASTTSPLTQSGIFLINASNQNLSGNYFPAGQSPADTTLAFITISDSSHTNQVFGSRIGMDSASVVQATSTMIGVLLSPSAGGERLRNNVISSNEIIGLSVPAIIVKRTDGGIVSSNYLGVDSIYLQRGNDQETYRSVRGLDSTAIIVDSVQPLNIIGNQIINYGDYGVDLQHSINVIVEKNVILSETSDLKAIQLNIGTDSVSNFGVLAPSIDTNLILSEDRIKLIGKADYPNAVIQIYEGYDSDSDTTEQSLRFVKNVVANADSVWEAIIPTSNYGFTKFNKYIAQVQLFGNSSEYGGLYTAKSTLCLLKAQGIRLTQTAYNPCPASNFTVNGQLDGINYEWIASQNEFETILTQDAAIDTSAHVTMKLSDDFNCTLEEEFDIIYKPRAQTPQFKTVAR